MRLIALGLILALAACTGRPLTEAEQSLVRAIKGEQIDLAPVRLHDGLIAGRFTYQRPIRPRLSCQERLYPPSRGETVTVSPGALVAFHRVYFRRDLYREDFLATLPDQIDLADAMLLAHEMTHVWQWQNRARTGYHPLKAANEHSLSPDPYLFDLDTDTAFLDYGFEQQASIVEEYLCCRLLDPKAPRTARLHALIAAEMPLDGLAEVVAGARVRVPWQGAETDGICR